jgi:hypothetical protein
VNSGTQPWDRGPEVVREPQTLVLPFPTRQYRLEVAMYAADASGPPEFGNGRMPNETAPSSSHGPELRHALAGLQAGVLGAILIVACLMIGSLWNGRSIWVVPNLFATTFYGSDVYRDQMLRTSWTGIALIVAIYGLLGVLWSCIWRDERGRWIGLYGAIAGLCVYFLFYDFLWRHINPLITLYAPDRQLQTGHLLWGFVLARSPLYARRIADSASDSTPHYSGGDSGITQAVHDNSASQEVRSGEVIR